MHYLFKLEINFSKFNLEVRECFAKKIHLIKYYGSRMFSFIVKDKEYRYIVLISHASLNLNKSG